MRRGNTFSGRLPARCRPPFTPRRSRRRRWAAHTWAVYSANQHREHPDESIRGADFSVDTTRDEGYVPKERFFSRYGANAELYWPKLAEAARQAESLLLTYDGEPALTVYHSMSDGKTEAAENVWQASLPYLVPVESEGDVLSPDYAVTETFDQKTMRYLLEQAFGGVTLSDQNPAGWIEPLERSGSGLSPFGPGGGPDGARSGTAQRAEPALKLHRNFLRRRDLHRQNEGLRPWGGDESVRRRFYGATGGRLRPGFSPTITPAPFSCRYRGQTVPHNL